MAVLLDCQCFRAAIGQRAELAVLILEIAERATVHQGPFHVLQQSEREIIVNAAPNLDTPCTGNLDALAELIAASKDCDTDDANDVPM